MATPEETSRLRTLADAVAEPGLSATFGSGTGPARFSEAGGIRGGFDVNKVSEEDEEGSVVVETRMMVGPDGLGLLEKVGDVGPRNGCGEGEFKGNGVALGRLYGKIGERNGTIEDLNVVDNGGNIMMDMDGERGGGYDAESIEGHDYFAGDLVWGKIKSHPWWPGQIYDPKDASDNALKFNQTGRLLVAYFGDRSFAWCLPSQLIPFAEHFDIMSKQSSSKSFVNAVQEAVDEIGRLVEIEMTCKCVPVRNGKGLDSPLAANAGIKAGVLVPEGGIGKLLSFRYDSAELLATVQNIATSVSFASALELAILKSWLSAFYRAIGGYSLCIYHEGLQIEGLDRNGITYRNVLSVPVDVPIQGSLEEDWSLALAGPGNGPAPSDNQIYYRRKQKSVAEIMAEVTDRKSKSRKRSVAPEGINASNSAKQKSKVDDDAGNQGAFGTVRKRGRKKINEIPNAEIGHVRPEEEIHKKSISTKLNEDEAETGVDDDKDDEGAKGTEEISSPRERKKSKYLSLPYTNSRFRSRNPILKKVSQKESEKISRIARIGECVTKAAGLLLESPPIVNRNGPSLENKMPEDGQLDASADVIPPKGKQGQQKVIDSMNVHAPVKQVLAEVVSVAVNPLHSWDERFLDLIRGFIFAFRSSVFNQSNHAPKRLPGRKRKSLISEQGAPEAKSPRAVAEKSSRDKCDKPKPKKTARDSGVKSNDTRVERKASPASLVVTFAPGFSLPSKDDIIRTFSKFGDLNEKETVVLPESSSIQIVYSCPSGAEEALRASLRQSPFGSPSVNYKLCYFSAAPVAESSHNTSFPDVRTLDKPVDSRSAADEKSQLGSIRQKLEIMTSMLGNCDGKISSEEVSKLDGEIKPLFEKVRKMAEAASH